MRRVFSYLFIIFVIFILGCVLIKRDIPEEYNVTQISSSDENIIYPAKNKNVTIDGIDFLQSHAPIGNYGGELVISTIGEGP